MSNALFEGRWDKFKDKLKEKWPKLTDEEIVKIEGRRDQLLKRLEEHYGWTREKTEMEVKDFERVIIAQHDQEAINYYYQEIYLKKGQPKK